MAPPNPAEAALAELGHLAASGAAPARMIQAVGTVIAGWAAEPEMDAAAAQERIEALWDSLGKDAADLEAAISDAESGDAAALARAKRSLAALRAAVAALAAAHARF